jgi:hypothetical protein
MDMEIDLQDEPELAAFLGINFQNPGEGSDSDTEDYALHNLIVENAPVPEENPTLPLVNCDIPQNADEINQGWTKPDIDSEHNVLRFHFEQGPLQMPSEGRSCMDFFEAFMEERMFDHIAEETNRYASAKMQEQGNDSFERSQHEQYKPRARLNCWKPITVPELKVFVAHLIIMGLVRKPDIEMYWSGAPFTKTPFFGVYMSRDRFTAILSNLHVNDDTDNPAYPDPGHDALAKVRNFIEMMDRNFLHVYKPEQNISIDEGSMPWKGRLRFRQYNPSKPARFHVKLFQVCEASSSYVVGYKVFTGTGSCHRDNISLDPEATTTTKTVLTLLEDCNLLHKSHTVYMDNYYNSPALLDELLERETLGCGTVRSNRKGLPKSIVKANMKEAGASCFRRKDSEIAEGAGMLCLKWVDKRSVMMLSTVHAATASWTGKRKRDEERTKIYKPTVIVDYTRLMGGVDLSDQLMNYYNFLRRSKKWWRKLWVHLLNMIIHNAFVLNKKFGDNKKLAHYEFREEIALKLIEKSGPARDIPSDNGHIPLPLLPGRLDGRHFLEKIPKGNRDRILPKGCKVCKVTKKDKRNGKGEEFVKYTTFMCDICKIPMCSTPCFKVYHTERDYEGALASLE